MKLSCPPPSLARNNSSSRHGGDGSSIAPPGPSGGASREGCPREEGGQAGASQTRARGDTRDDGGRGSQGPKRSPEGEVRWHLV